MKKGIIYTSILMMFLTSAFSCCLLPIAEAEAAPVEMSCQHHESSDQAAEETTVGCDCPEMISLIKKAQNLSAFDHLVIAQAVILDLSILDREADHVVFLSDAGPPSSDIPIYIQHSVLRI